MNLPTFPVLRSLPPAHRRLPQTWRSPVPALVTAPAFELRLPQFPLEALLRGVAECGPIALLDEVSACLTHVNGAAVALGVRAGLAPRAARAFCPALTLLGRDSRAEEAALAGICASLGLAGYQVVTSAGPGGELGLKIFAGAAGDDQSAGPVLRRELRALGFRSTPALTPLGPIATPRPRERLASQPDFHSRLVFPWVITRPHAINHALQRLESDLLAALRLAGRELRWLQVIAEGERGGRAHQRFEQAESAVLVRAMSAVRARLHREPGVRLKALELHAGLGLAPAPGSWRGRGLQ